LKVGAGLGKGIRSFKEALKSADVKEDLEKLENKKTETTSPSSVEKKFF